MNKKAPILILIAVVLIAVVSFQWRKTSKDSDIALDPQELPESNGNQDRELNRSGSISLSSSLTDASVRWEVRVDRVRNFQLDELSQADIDVLFELLTYEPDQQHQQEDWWVVLNEIMDQLRKTASLHDRFTEAMLSLMSDDGQHEVVRDYAVQHLGLAMMPTSQQSAEQHDFTQAQLQSSFDHFAQVITDPSLQQGSIPGTTLTLLTHLNQTEVAPEILEQTLESLKPWLNETVSGESEASLSVRTTAINSAGDLQIEELTPTIRNLAYDTEEDINIRLNAIAALGQLGEAQDLTHLQSIANSTSKLKFAAKSALNNLQN